MTAPNHVDNLYAGMLVASLTTFPICFCKPNAKAFMYEEGVMLTRTHEDHSRVNEVHVRFDIRV